MKKTLIQKLGLLGVVSFLSYMAAVIFAPLAYPGYDWMAQAVSDLSAANAPSLALWNQLSSLYNACELPCVMMVCVGIQGQKNKLLRVGIYLFAAMEWVSAVGFRMFPLSDSGYAGAWQDQMHLITTALVVALFLLLLFLLTIPRKPFAVSTSNAQECSPLHGRELVLHGVLFVLCLLAVFSVLSWQILLGVVLAALLLFAGGSWLEKRSRKPETRTELPQETAETMEVDGVTYRRRTDLTTILVMGIDHDSEVEAEGSYQGGQADFQRLIVIDSKDKTVRQLKIDRDTMAEVTVLGMLGNPVGTTQMQISLAHGFGDGKEESCGYARDAVSRLLQGENIDFYLAMSLDGISVLNDLAGGVTVTLEDDFSAADPAMTKGTTLTLHGDQAEIFVRRRMDIGEGTNEARMVRQEEYLTQLSAQLESRVQQDQQFTAQVYDALQPYLVTDLAKGQLVNEVWAAKDDTVEPAIALEGEHKVAEDGFTEFYPTEASIQKAVLTLFWEPVEE